MFNLVTVRCGHCSNLLTVNMGASLQVVPPQDSQQSHKQQQLSLGDSIKDRGSSSKCNKIGNLDSAERDRDQHRIPPIRRNPYCSALGFQQGTICWSSQCFRFYFNIKRSIRRLTIVEAGSKRVEGIISLSDIFKFLLS